MVQDTSYSPEVYLADLHGRTGGWGVAESLEETESASEELVDYDNLDERAVLWAVSIPGQADWTQQPDQASSLAGMTSLNLS